MENKSYVSKKDALGNDVNSGEDCDVGVPQDDLRKGIQIFPDPVDSCRCNLIYARMALQRFQFPWQACNPGFRARIHTDDQLAVCQG